MTLMTIWPISLFSNQTTFSNYFCHKMRRSQEAARKDWSQIWRSTFKFMEENLTRDSGSRPGFSLFGNQDFQQILTLLCQTNPFFASALTFSEDKSTRELIAYKKENLVILTLSTSNWLEHSAAARTHLIISMFTLTKIWKYASWKWLIRMAICELCGEGWIWLLRFWCIIQPFILCNYDPCKYSHLTLYHV